MNKFAKANLHFIHDVVILNDEWWSLCLHCIYERIIASSASSSAAAAAMYILAICRKIPICSLSLCNLWAHIIAKYSIESNRNACQMWKYDKPDMHGLWMCIYLGMCHKQIKKSEQIEINDFTFDWLRIFAPFRHACVNTYAHWQGAHMLAGICTQCHAQNASIQPVSPKIQYIWV